MDTFLRLETGQIIQVASPLISAQILNAFYSALLLRKQEGVDLTEELKGEVLEDLLAEWASLSDRIRVLGGRVSEKPGNLDSKPL